MEEIKLDVQVRRELGRSKIKTVRRDNFVPAIVYGGDQKPTHIKVDRRAFERIRRLHHGEIVFHLNVLEGDKKLRDYSAIVKEEQHHPVDDHILHIDFKRISLKEKIEVKVTIEAEGEPVGVKRDGGTLEHVIWELEIICLPTQIPQELKVDVSGLAIDDVIHVRDLKLPDGVETEHDPDSIVFTVSAPKDEEPAEPAEGAITEPEVTREKKKDPAAAGEEGKKSDKPEKAEKSEKKPEKKAE